MHYDFEVVTPPAATPVSVADVKAHLRVLHATEDALITALVGAATAHVEARLSRALVTQSLRLVLDAFPCRARPIRLLRPPVIAVTLLKYLPPTGAEVTLAAETYVLAKNNVEADLSPKSGAWPVALDARRVVTVEYTAGYGAAVAVPADIKHAILLLIEHLYQNRSAVSDTAKIVTPMAVEALLGPHMTGGWI